MQNVETDINKESSMKDQQVAVRDGIVNQREQRMMKASAQNARRLEYGDHSNNLLAKYSGSKMCDMPHAQRFHRYQVDARAEFRGEAVPMKGANDPNGPEKSSHTKEMIALHKHRAKGLSHHIKSDPVKVHSEAVDNVENIKAREMRERILNARKRQLIARDTATSAVPHTLARSISISCKAAEREESLKTYTEGNEEAYAVVDQLNKAAMGYTDTAENGAQKQADEFNMRQRMAAVAKQRRGAGQSYAGHAAAAQSEIDQQ